jgi:hypothetical protein
MPALFGPVLTNTPTVSSFLSAIAANRLSAAKVVTGWGLNTAWDDYSRALLVKGVSRLIVRSTCGDPSNRGTNWLPDPDLLVEEFRPWVKLRPDIWLEVGNEPDVAWERPDIVNAVGTGEYAIWSYRYWLELAEARLRKEFPRAQLIAPSPRVGHFESWYRWVEIPADVLRRFNALSAHIYGWHLLALDQTDTQQYFKLKRYYEMLFPGKSVAVTEAGIHSSQLTPQQKLDAYRAFAQKMPTNWRWVLFYHFNANRVIHPEYSVLP